MDWPAGGRTIPLPGQSGPRGLIRSRLEPVAAKIFDLRSEITLLDEALKFVGRCFMHIVTKTPAKSLYEVPVAANLSANPLSEEFLAEGRKMGGRINPLAA